MNALLPGRQSQILVAGDEMKNLGCEKPSLAGSVSQRACVFCGSRVVLYPIADAVHLVHGPVGCAAYTWDIRGALSSGPELHRLSFSTDLQEKDVVFGGEKKLKTVLAELIPRYNPEAVFVYTTCIVGLIGDDESAVCRKFSARYALPVIPVQSEGFKGSKKDGYKAAGEALMTLIGTGETSDIGPLSVNILGEFNLAGETWILKEYYKKMGLEVVSVLTGDGRIADIRRAHGARLNLVQCSGSMTSLAKTMEEKYSIPFIRVSYFGIEDMAEALYSAARQFPGHPQVMLRAQTLVRDELTRILPALEVLRKDLEGKKAAIYVGGAFKSFSLVKALRHLGIATVLVGSQTGNKEDYRQLQELCDPGTIILDDSNPAELTHFLLEKKADIFIGGVKERSLAYKLGLGFVDHNHERKVPLAGFQGMLEFAREVHRTATSPVWKYTRPRNQGVDL